MINSFKSFTGINKSLNQKKRCILSLSLIEINIFFTMCKQKIQCYGLHWLAEEYKCFKILNGALNLSMAVYYIWFPNEIKLVMTF